MNNITKLVLTLLFGLVSCKSTITNKEVAVKNPIELEISEKTGKLSSNSDCTRGIAEPIVKKTIFPETIFELQEDSLSGLETVEFENGDRLIIKNWGCEYYVLTFRFETLRFEADTTNIIFWYEKVELLLRELNKGLNAPIDISKGINALHKHIIMQHKKLKLGQDINFGINELQNTLTIDRVEKLKDKKMGLEFSFTTGVL